MAAFQLACAFENLNVYTLYIGKSNVCQICLETHSPKNHIDLVFKHIDYVYRHRFPLKDGI